MAAKKEKDNSGLLIGVLVIGAIGAGYWYLSSQKQQQPQQPTDPISMWANAGANVLGSGSGFVNALTNFGSLFKKQPTQSNMNPNW